MAVVELDPMFVKALKLLQSRTKDSTEQLKTMLLDVLANKKVKTDLTSLTSKVSPKDEDERWEMACASSPARSLRQSEKDSGDLVKKRDSEKRQHEKLGKGESFEPEAKKPKLEARPSPAHTPEPRPEKSKDREKSKDKSKDSHKERSKDSHRDKSSKDSHSEKSRDKDKSHRDKDREREKREREREREKEKEREREREREKERLKAEVKPEIISSESDNDEDDLLTMDADNFAMGMGITCIVCKQMNQSSGNQLVECQECHNLYHQECHRPPVTEQDVNDPRFVWYCSRCMKNMKKMVSKPSKQKIPPVTIPKEAVINKPPKVETPTLLPFKRMLDPAKPPASRESSSSSSRGQGVGLAGLAGLAAKSKMSSTPDASKTKNPFESSKLSKAESKSSLAMSAGTGLAMLANAAAATKSEKTGSSKVKPPSLNPDKRLQMMKKKAAAKQLEKRAK